MGNKSDEELIDFYFPLWLCFDRENHAKIEKSKSFFDLPGYLKHDSEKK